MLKVIAFSGKIGSGKSTTCDMVTRLLQERGYTVIRIAYAKPLKDIVAYVTNDKRDLFYTQEGKAANASTVNSVTRRKLLNSVGNAFTDIDPTIFCQYSDIVMKHEAKGKKNVIVLIEDLRRFKELTYIAKNYNHHIVRIPRSFNPCDDPEIKDSPQECELDYLDTIMLSYTIHRLELYRTVPNKDLTSEMQRWIDEENCIKNKEDNIRNINKLLDTIIRRFETNK